MLGLRPWTANPLDLNPAENLLGIVKRKIGDSRSTDAEELKVTIRATWAFSSVTDRSRHIAVIHANQAPTNHWVRYMFREHSNFLKHNFGNDWNALIDEILICWPSSFMQDWCCECGEPTFSMSKILSCISLRAHWDSASFNRACTSSFSSCRTDSSEYRGGPFYNRTPVCECRGLKKKAEPQMPMALNCPTHSSENNSTKISYYCNHNLRNASILMFLESALHISWQLFACT